MSLIPGVENSLLVSLGALLGGLVATFLYESKRRKINLHGCTTKTTCTVEKGKTIALCRCWQSSTFPFCDGTHVKLNLTGENVGPALVTATEQRLVAQRGPCKVHVEAGSTYYWCQCGRSKQQPFCDGSHKDTGLEPLEFKAEKTEDLFFCACKQTKAPPLCDGSHNSLEW